MGLWPPDFGPSFLRALVLGLLAVGLHRLLVPGLGQCPFGRVGRVLLWGGLALPFLTPPLLTAYAYTKPFLHLVRYPKLEELCYSALVFFRVYPVALLAAVLLPRRLSVEGWHCQRLVPPTMARPWRFRFRHLEPVDLVSALLVFLYALHEFEMASLLQRPAWTVAIFDAQAQGYALGETWRRVWPLGLLQVTGVLALLVLVGKCEGFAELPPVGRWARKGVIAYVALAALVMSLLPAWLISREALQGLARLPEAFSMQREVGDSLVVAFVSSVLAYLIGMRLSRHGALGWRAVLLVPGLLGTLLLSLILLAFSQWPGVLALRDRPLVLVLGLTLSLLPVLTVLMALAYRRERSEASWCARLMGSRRLLWAFGRGPHLGVWAVGFYLAYFEVTIAAILAPASMTPVMVRLYNLMHYGRDSMLSGYVLVVVTVPFFILALATALGYALTSRRG